jgi:ZIP family zinc transporter
LIDVLIPHDYMAEHHHTEQEKHDKKLLKTGMLVALGLGIHNLPEGMAAFAGALEDPSLGIAIAIAIAIHNIPEGVAISAPVYKATGSRSKAFWWSFISGVAEPSGAGLALSWRGASIYRGHHPGHGNHGSQSMDVAVVVPLPRRGYE